MKLYTQQFNQTKPEGWLKIQMQNDLENGFVGHLNELVPELFEKDDIYFKTRRGKSLADFSLGLANDDSIDLSELQWWNSETQSQWYDGMIRHSFLLDNEEYIEKSKVYVEKILKSADDDGYIGIYTPDSRYSKKEQSGELWAEATLFRGLLAYYEATNDEKVYEAVKKAIDVTIENYWKGHEGLFEYEQTHGLMISDILVYIYKKNNDIKYLDYLEWLYKEYCKVGEVIGVDAQKQNIVDEDYRLEDHGVHTYEHLRILTVLAYLTGKQEYSELLKKYEEKISKCICPSGGGIGDEWIGGHFADATRNGYEFCSTQELLHDYFVSLELTGDLIYADKIENIFFNAGQGARNPNESSIAYLKSDNSYSMEGGFHIEREDIKHNAHIRYKYSPTHQEAAVCCVPNAGRIATYYTQAMWLNTETGLLKAVYVDGVLRTKYNGVDVRITEEGNYPFGSRMKFTLEFSKECDLQIAFRIPTWCNAPTVYSDREYDIENNIITFKGKWSGKDKENIEIDFNTKIDINTDLLGQSYFTYGALVLAMPLQSKMYVTREYGLLNLRDTCFALDDEIPNNLFVDDNTLKSFNVTDQPKGWLEAKWSAKLFDEKSGENKEVQFVPMGGAVLRQVTFQNKK